MASSVSNTPYHTPVLLKESVDALAIKPNGIYVDVTFGGGGHSREILNRLGEQGRLIAFDRDSDAQTNKIDDPRFTLIANNFRFLHSCLRYYNIETVDGILADLGVSSHQFDESGRGFSFRFDSQADMRMNREADFSARELLKLYSQSELQHVFKTYGELNNASRLAQAIVSKRGQKQIDTTVELIEVATPFLPKKDLNTQLAKLFQAIRIEVNKEMPALEQLMLHSLKVLKTGGRLVVITYHSLEDRLVKNFMKSGNLEGNIVKDFYGNAETPFILCSKKAIIPTDEEIVKNSRARSAKLRIAEKK
ncbi:MAG: 16S rRNA (cytosine(1402)-N(4))-methyltransferase RsmH [Prevotellaceae bacterium]|jgi:16S rRNA (cytosine1402-N4)-methyltransferase|nr:16S rRNA (cytosine(1402)-N(4))-methyltransferase RsmH [Prevotellaceae bacterium]